MNAEFAFFEEVEHAITVSTGARRAEMVRRLTDLVSVNATTYSDDEMTLIDDVFVRLVVTIEEFLPGAAGNTACAAVQGASENSQRAGMRQCN